MTIWLLGIVLLASLAGLGYRQGAIRVAFSFAGILVGALLAVPLGHLLMRPLMAVGLQDPLMAWAVGPLIMFLVISFVFKTGGFVVHRKAEVYYRYRTADVRQSLWERLNRRLGLCLGLVNGLLYLLLISWVIYAFSYCTIQLASSDTDPRGMRILNRLGWDLQKSGFAPAARAIDRMPKIYYDLADFVGMLLCNPQVRTQLDHYPVVMSLMESPDFKDLLTDKDLGDLWAKQPPISELLSQPKIQALLKNTQQLKLLEDTAISDLADLNVFLTTGASPKYDPETILGYWDVDPNASLSLLVRAKPTLTFTQMTGLRTTVAQVFLKTTLIALPEHKVLLKALPSLGAVASGMGGINMSKTDLVGEWKKVDDAYQITFSGEQSLTGALQGEQLLLKGGPLVVVFEKEN